MTALVTGAAGFIGSALCERLLAQGEEIYGVDCFTPFYAPAYKHANLRSLLAHPRFTLHEVDLRATDVGSLLVDVDVVYHLAAQPGVRASWEDFPTYVEHNIVATQRLLDALQAHGGEKRMIFASSSSVYGDGVSMSSTESDVPRPHSPYGVTKLAAEQLCAAYGANFGVHTVLLRYFTVYGPRQRPDMGIHRLIEAALRSVPFPRFGDGSHVRSFTFVEDVVDGTIAAASADVAPGSVINIAGGESTTISQLITLVEELTGRVIDVDRRPAQPGDVHRTDGQIERAARWLGWRPRIGLRAGVAQQVSWHRRLLAEANSGEEHVLDQKIG